MIPAYQRRQPLQQSFFFHSLTQVIYQIQPHIRQILSTSQIQLSHVQIYIASQERNFILVLTLLMIFNISKFQYQNPHSSNPICHSIPKPQHTDPTHYTSTFELLVTLFHQKCRFTFSHIIPKKLQAALPPLSIESVNY